MGGIELANFLIEGNSNLTDYFIKRLIAVETSEKKDEIVYIDN